MPGPIRILYCHCAQANVLPHAVKESVLKQLCEGGVSFEAVPDLCEMAARKNPWLGRLAQADTLAVAACYPRAVKWMFAAAQAPLSEGVQLLNMRQQSADEIASALLAGKAVSSEPALSAASSLSGQQNGDAAFQVVLRLERAAVESVAILSQLLDKGYQVSCPGGAVENDSVARPVLILGYTPESQASNGQQYLNISGLTPAQVLEKVESLQAKLQLAPARDWLPWFPVIDFERCTHCMQCLSFCLFGVFGVDAEQQLEVQQSEQCKTNCPACSRVCPEAAIIFPKYKMAPINGEEIKAADVQREKMKVDLSALLGGDIYTLLRQRSERAQSRFSQERDAQKALQERQRCLAQLVQAADIPPEVLMALPSPEEIQRKAQEAQAKAQAALQKALKPTKLDP